MNKVTAAERQRQIQQLALQLQSEKMEQRFKTVRLFIFITLLLGLLAYIYTQYANKRIASSRSNITAQLNHEIGLAASGDVLIKQKLSEQLPLLEQYITFRIAQSQDVGKRDLQKLETWTPITAFVRIAGKTLSVGKINSPEQIATVNHAFPVEVHWLKATLSPGLSVWVNSSSIAKHDQSSQSGITTSNTDVRRTPMSSDDNIVGRFEEGVDLKILEVRGEWLKVQTPRDFEFLIRKKEHLKLLAKASSNKQPN